MGQAFAASRQVLSFVFLAVEEGELAPGAPHPPDIHRGTYHHAYSRFFPMGSSPDSNWARARGGGRTQDHYNKAYADFANTQEKHAGGASTGGGTAGLAGVAGVGGREGSEGAAVEPPAGSTTPPRQRAT